MFHTFEFNRLDTNRTRSQMTWLRARVGAWRISFSLKINVRGKKKEKNEQRDERKRC